ncbi:MAG: hypothetical protein JWN41_887 [Thermoleophilia bacterium]|nr:hypothetical protein [Thermoleophilia bacterium]
MIGVQALVVVPPLAGAVAPPPVLVPVLEPVLDPVVGVEQSTGGGTTHVLDPVLVLPLVEQPPPEYESTVGLSAADEAVESELDVDSAVDAATASTALTDASLPASAAVGQTANARMATAETMMVRGRSGDMLTSSCWGNILSVRQHRHVSRSNECKKCISICGFCQFMGEAALNARRYAFFGFEYGCRGMTLRGEFL